MKTMGKNSDAQYSWQGYAEGLFPSQLMAVSTWCSSSAPCQAAVAMMLSAHFAGRQYTEFEKVYV
jgi:hypothetical protein